MEVAKWHFRVSVKSYFRTGGFLTPFGTWVGLRNMGGFSAVCNFNVSRDNKIPEAEWVSVIPAWEVWVHIHVYVDHLTVRYQLIFYTALLSGTPFDSYLIFSFFSFTYTLTSHSAVLKSKSLSSIWMAPG